MTHRYVKQAGPVHKPWMGVVRVLLGLGLGDVEGAAWRGSIDHCSAVSKFGDSICRTPTQKGSLLLVACCASPAESSRFVRKT